jgi:hypothetical protein
MTLDEILAAIPTLSGDDVAVVRDSLPPTASPWSEPKGSLRSVRGRTLDDPQVWCAAVFPLDDGRWCARVRSLRGPAVECVRDSEADARVWCDQRLADDGIALRTKTG